MTIPDEVADDLRRARRLEWWTLAWLASIVVVMALSSSGSQAFTTALAEDVLSLVPAIVFLVATHFEGRDPTRLFPFGFDRVHSLAFLIAAVALAAVGGFLAAESLLTLLGGERAHVPPVMLAGQWVWSGWVMVAALIYSVVPPFILGRMKLPVARRLQDKVLHTDAMMQKADWMTGLAGVLGIVGIGYGLWWADALAALVIALDVLHDGIRALRSATAELVDGMPRALEDDTPAADAVALHAFLVDRYPGAEIRLRETGRYMRAEVVGASADDLKPGTVDVPGLDRDWRFSAVTYIPGNAAEGERLQAAGESL